MKVICSRLVRKSCQEPGKEHKNEGDWQGVVASKTNYKELTIRFCCSVNKLRPTFCDPIDGSVPGSPVLHYLPELAQIHAYGGSDII